MGRARGTSGCLHACLCHVLLPRTHAALCEFLSSGSKGGIHAEHACILSLQPIVLASAARLSLAKHVASGPWQCRKSGPILGAILRPQNRAGKREPQLLGFTLRCPFLGPESGPKIGPPSCCEIHRSRCSRAALPLMRADAPLICKVCACAGGFVSLVLCVVSIAPHAACVDLVGRVLHATRGVSRSRRVCSVVCAHAS